MRAPLLLLLSALACAQDAPPDAPLDAHPDAGFPLHFASFENVGANELLEQPLALAEADRRLTEWTRGCPADAYVLLNDRGRYDPLGFKRLQRHAEHAMTRGSLLTAEPLDLHELALDLEAYCEAELVELGTETAPNITTYVDTKPRVFYVDLAPGLDEERRNAVLDEVLRVVPSPFTTVVYVSQVAQSRPILRSVRLSAQRAAWTRRRLRHDARKIAPVIAPLFNHRKPLEEPVLELPDSFFVSLLVGSVGVVALLAWRDYGARRDRRVVARIRAERAESAERAERARQAAPTPTAPDASEAQVTQRKPRPN